MRAFNKQENFIRLRNIISESTSPICLFVGSGMSISAKLPSWNELIDILKERLKDKIENIVEYEEKNKLNGVLINLSRISDPWSVISLLSENLGKTTFRNTIRNIFRNTHKCKIPRNYETLMKLNPKGIISLNLDSLVTNAYRNRRATTPVVFNGFECGDFLHTLQENRTFIANMHGQCEKESSWVLTREQLDSVFKNNDYNDFMKTVLLTCKTIFVGISVDDFAVKAHLDKLKNYDSGASFWITERRDRETLAFCEEYNILPVVYDPKDNHNELSQLIEELTSHTPEEEIINAPVLNSRKVGKVRNFKKEELNNLSGNELRQKLNDRAKSIVRPGTTSSYAAYRDFLNEHKKLIHQAWFVDIDDESDNKLFNYTLHEEIGDGAFGTVYKATNEKSETVAVKLLKFDVMKDDNKLQSFRRGVQSMEILTRNKDKANGMIEFYDYSEIPSYVSMEFIEGCDLKEYIESKQASTWRDKLILISEIARILKESHNLPERVLHRDLRPPNIMIRNPFSDEKPELVLLDFDLAWYKGASEVSIDQKGSINGFLAPEQVDLNSTYSTRTALVDSFGVGMLMYFVVTSKIPHFMQHKNKNWTKTLECISKQKCKEWVSVPFRVSNLILQSTKHDQSKRPDMSAIWGELSLLNNAISNPDTVRSIELIVNEIGILTCKKASQFDRHKWDGDKVVSSIALLNGLTITVSGNESDRDIHIYASWDGSRTSNWGMVKTKLPSLIQQSRARLKRMGFNKITSDVSARSGSISGDLSVEKINYSKIDQIAQSLSGLVERFNFN